MCIVYKTTTIVGKETETKITTDECNEKPTEGTAEQCPNFKLITAASSRRKKGLPSWASGNGKGPGGSSATPSK